MSILISKDHLIYHIGDRQTHQGLDCNPYLLIDGDEAVLFDPGNCFDVEAVYENIVALIPASAVKYIVLHHQDPDFCSAVPLLEAKGIHAKIITSWRAQTLIQYYGIQSEFKLIEELGNKLELASGRTLRFILTPYLHFAGAFVTYDPKSTTLFSSDLFGAYSYNNALYADDQYIEKMETFHEHYMPSNAVLRPVMELLSKYDIQLICPQHGSIINSDIQTYIDVLKNLECGTLMSPIKKRLLDTGGYLTVFNEVYTRYKRIYPTPEVQALFKQLDYLAINDDDYIVNYNMLGQELWQKLFTDIKRHKNILWLTSVEPFIRGKCSSYDLPMPEAFTDLIEVIVQENQLLAEVNANLDATIHTVQEKLIRCPITGLYNQAFFHSVLTEEFEHLNDGPIGSLILFSIDNLSKIKFKFGEDDEGQIYRNITYHLKERFPVSSLYKMTDCDFAIYLKDKSEADVIATAEELRESILTSELFLSTLTITGGIAFPKEMDPDAQTTKALADSYIMTALNKLRLGKLQGKNRIVSAEQTESVLYLEDKVLVVDSEGTNVTVLKKFLTELGVPVLTASDGLAALAIAQKEHPKVIIAEVQLPKMDAFLLRESLLRKSDTKDIHFIYLSHYKNEASVKRAMELGVYHYIKKPYILYEVLGVTLSMIKGLIT